MGKFCSGNIERDVSTPLDSRMKPKANNFNNLTV
jgi:hypothetical protein